MKNIFLIGMPSSGKSTLGRQLVKMLHKTNQLYEFIDLDARIEASENLKVTEIFSLKGEDYFRKIENEHLKKIPKNSYAVIATGGGTPCFYDGIEYIKNNGISIFLNVPPEKIAKRISSAKTNDRPLFDIKNQELLQSVTEKYNQRLQIYNQADIIIEGDTDAESILWILEAEFAKS